MAPPPASGDSAGTRFRYALLLREIDSLRAADRTSTLALLLIQLNGLDDVNGRYGYLVGDKVLDEFAGRLAGVGRDQDRLFEVNARSFALLIHNPLHEAHAVLAADKVARAALEPIAIGPLRARLRPHIGIAVLKDPAGTSQDLVRHCELALAAARSRDENHVLFTPELLPAVAPEAQHSRFDVEEALKAGDFELFYQPQVDLATGRLAGAEALVRWRNGSGGYVPPAQFLPALENSQGVRPLLWFVLNSTLRQAAGWADALPGFGVSVNVAAGNLDDPDLVEQVESALGMWDLPPGRLILELTESSIMRNPVASTRLLGQLRGLGPRISIDDFGTGYSSLAYLRDLPADELKIDRSFVVNAAARERDRNIVASVVQLAHAVDLKVVAEGIEDEAVLRAMAGIGADIGQGYHFGAPMPARDFEARWVQPEISGSRKLAVPE